MKENEKILAFELWDSTGKSVAKYYEDITKLPLCFQQKIMDNYTEDGIRNIYRNTESGSVRLIVKDDNPLFQGTKLVTRSCSVYLSLIPRFKQIESSSRQHFDSIIKRFAHNLIKFQIRFKNNFSRLISDTARSRPFSEFQDEVKRRIESNTNIAAQDVCQMSHRAFDLDAQIDTLRVISGYADPIKSDDKIKVDLQKAIFRLTNPFIEELRKKNIEINVNIPAMKTGVEKVIVAPGLFNSAIWQLLDNASKYVLNDTNININAVLDKNPKKLEFSMISIRIDEDEKETIFLEGQKGRHAGNKGENGIGLFIVRKALGLMNSKIYIEIGESEGIHNGFEYCKNKFIIEFNK
jgi:signal transduction histidine kinase